LLLLFVVVSADRHAAMPQIGVQDAFGNTKSVNDLLAAQLAFANDSLQ
jgi:hypothetical protein